MTEDDSHSERERAVQQAEAHELLTNIEKYVNGPILNQDDLARAAVEIRQLLADEDGTCLCQFYPQETCTCTGVKPPVPDMDVRGRKWAAAKLLQPIESSTTHIFADLDDDAVLETLVEYWKIRTLTFAERPIEKYARMVLQFRHSKVFVCRAWNIPCPPPTKQRGSDLL
jgi:hypothetical protein